MLDARVATDPVRHPAQLLTSFNRAKSLFGYDRALGELERELRSS